MLQHPLHASRLPNCQRTASVAVVSDEPVEEVIEEVVEDDDF